MTKSFNLHSRPESPAPAPAQGLVPPQGGASGLIHAAIIMDGSGRWAEARGLERSAGHRAGVQAVRRAVQAAAELGIGTLTLHAFSSNNWQRPAAEVRELMNIFEEFLRGSVAEWVECGVRTTVIGRRDRLEPNLVAAIEAAETATREGRRLRLRLAIDYSARDAILRAARALGRSGGATPEEFARALGEAGHETAPVPDPDLLVRAGGEQRLSDFMLWECAYAELVFTERLWPEFGEADLEAAVLEFRSRHRRFGRLTEAALVRP
jgi:undecaprenyl diphosphate synthase